MKALSRGRLVELTGMQSSRRMSKVSYASHHFPPATIQRAVWLYLRFNMGLRDVEGLLAQRSIDISYETVHHWVVKFGTASSCFGAGILGVARAGQKSLRMCGT